VFTLFAIEWRQRDENMCVCVCVQTVFGHSDKIDFAKSLARGGSPAGQQAAEPFLSIKVVCPLSRVISHQLVHLERTIRLSRTLKTDNPNPTIMQFTVSEYHLTRTTSVGFALLCISFLSPTGVDRFRARSRHRGRLCLPDCAGRRQDRNC